MWASSRVHETVFRAPQNASKKYPSAKSSGFREYSPSRSSSACFSPDLSHSTSVALPDCLERGTADASEMRVLDEMQVRRNHVR